jgi:glutathione S-transferase
MSLIVYGGYLSPFVRKVVVALREKGLDFASEPINPFMPPPDYRNISPLGRIPALRDGEVVLADSGVIMAYIERKHPGQPLVPADPATAARVLWLEKYADYELGPNCTHAVFRNRVMMRILQREVDEAAVEKAVSKRLPPLLDYLETQLGNQEFFVGNELTLADIAIASQFCNLQYGRVDVDTGRWPRMAAFIQRMHARPSFQEFMGKDRRFIEKMLGADYFAA